MYEALISQLSIYEEAVRNSFKRLLAYFPLSPSKLQKILREVKKTIQTPNLNYDIVIKRLHLYYDMKLVTSASIEIKI